MNKSSHYAENTRFLESTHNPEHMQQFLEEQLLDQSLEVRIVKNLDIMALKLQFHHPITQRTSYGLISRGKSRFVDELHMSNVELRSSAEILSELQKAEGGESCLAVDDKHPRDFCGHSSSQVSFHTEPFLGAQE